MFSCVECVLLACVHVKSETCVECVLLACVDETADAVVSTDEVWCIECQYIPSCKHIFPTIFDKISSNIIIFAVLIECVLLYIYQNIK